MNRNKFIRLVIRSTYSTFSRTLGFMLRILDVAPLRSFVAVADCGGFQRAANSLHLSQGAVSQHVRRLEAAVGRPLVERQGRGSRFTADGDTLLRQARRILALHDETLRDFGVESEQTLVIGSPQHAAAPLLSGSPAWPVRSRRRSPIAVSGSASTAARNCVRRWRTAGSTWRCCSGPR